MNTAQQLPSSDDAARCMPFEDDIAQQKYGCLQEFEHGLFATKWFDYRHMTPAQATATYIDAYEQVYSIVYARELDRRASEFAKPVTNEKIQAGLGQGITKQKRNYVGCWRGRQIADALGMPYAIYLDLAFTYRLRKWNRPYLPTPSHLYHEFDVEKIQLRWDEMQLAILYTSDHPAYLVQNYRNIAHQNDYHEWLLKQASHRSTPAHFLARFVREDQLPIEKVETRVEPYVFEQVELLLQ